MPDSLLKGKVALIFGGSQGIGLETAKVFAEEGATVIITGRTLSTLEQAAKEIKGEVTTIQSDMSLKEDRDSLFSKLKGKYAKINIAFINAGIAEGEPLNAVTEEFFEKHVATNYRGAFFAAQQSAEMMESKGTIIFTSSIAGSMGIEYLSVYSSTKAAVTCLARTLAAELSKEGIRVNAISPGYIATPLGLRNNQAHLAEISNTIPLEQRFGTPKEVANVALFLASEMSSYITGQDLIVDGGLSTTIPTAYSRP